MNTDEKFELLSAIVPLNCNIVKGFLGDTLDLTTCGVNTQQGIVALPPFMKVPMIIEHYWDSIKDGSLLILDAGMPQQQNWRYDGVGFTQVKGKDTVIKEVEGSSADVHSAPKKKADPIKGGIILD